ncbi:hypothetical protein C2142_04275 [Streptomyces sp. CB01881]|nr:hypothetical protein C2142_04275 [Streptomyces sp. CB01881]
MVAARAWTWAVISAMSCSPKAGANARRWMRGQPGPSNCAETSHEASVLGLAGGACSRARAYRSTSPWSASPTMPEESSRYISARVTLSMAVRSVRTTV